MPGSILVIDDDRLFCEALGDALAPEGINVVSVHSVSEARALSSKGYGVVVLDNNLEDDSGLVLVPEFERNNHATNIILCTAHPHLDNAVQALRLRLFDYHVKPVDLTSLLAAVRRGLGESNTVAPPTNNRLGAAKLQGHSAAIGELRRMVELAARASAPVLITGPTGTGKTLVARALHEAGSGERPFIHVNCAALPESLVEAELFGAERGAFTGAAQARRGLFEQASGGTLFLDEVAELPLAAQAKVLLALEEGWIRRVGGVHAIHVRVRVVAATNVDVERALESGRMRADLLYRLNVLRLVLPPLAEHLEDLEEIVPHLLRLLPGGDGRTLAAGELQALASYHWPGNTRELRNLLERALVLQPHGDLRPSALLPLPDRVPISTTRVTTKASSQIDVVSLQRHEQDHILTTFRRCGGNRAQTARVLGVSVATLRRKLSRWGVSG
jgi:two-component system, NtrC family, response regulator AtoC